MNHGLEDLTFSHSFQSESSEIRCFVRLIISERHEKRICSGGLSFTSEKLSFLCALTLSVLSLHLFPNFLFLQEQQSYRFGAHSKSLFKFNYLLLLFYLQRKAQPTVLGATPGSVLGACSWQCLGKCVDPQIEHPPQFLHACSPLNLSSNLLIISFKTFFPNTVIFFSGVVGKRHIWTCSRDHQRDGI